MEENIGRLLLFDINHNKIFYDPSPRAMEIKAKINNQDLIKCKSFVQQRKPQTKQKDKLRLGENNREKVFANDVPDKD